MNRVMERHFMTLWDLSNTIPFQRKSISCTCHDMEGYLIGFALDTAINESRITEVPFDVKLRSRCISLPSCHHLRRLLYRFSMNKLHTFLRKGTGRDFPVPFPLLSDRGHDVPSKHSELGSVGYTRHQNTLLNMFMSLGNSRGLTTLSSSTAAGSATYTLSYWNKQTRTKMSESNRR
jgi:hypothetical protein